VLRILVISSLLWCSSAATGLADYLPQNIAYPGGIAIIPIQSPNQPTVYLNDQRTPVLPDSKDSHHWLAIIGLPLTLSAGEQHITITNPVRQQQSFIVAPLTHSLPEPTIIKSPQEQALLAERDSILAITRQYSATNPFAQAFVPPVRGVISHRFGDVNDQLAQLYVTVSVPVGTQVIAPTNAVAIAIKELPLLGQTVFLDHGQGVITAYSQLTDITVQAGQYVAQGKPIGQIGAVNDNATAPLIWHAVINQAFINPLLLLDPTVAIDPCQS
jgi:murein DD-endopeptidase MepM/ murein hydrolase activator NlpD